MFNVGTVQFARQMDKAALANYLASFGLGNSTDIELPGKSGGTMGLLPGTDMADYTRDQISYSSAEKVEFRVFASGFPRNGRSRRTPAERRGRL